MRIIFKKSTQKKLNEMIAEAISRKGLFCIEYIELTKKEYQNLVDARAFFEDENVEGRFYNSKKEKEGITRYHGFEIRVEEDNE